MFITTLFQKTVASTLGGYTTLVVRAVAKSRARCFSLAGGQRPEGPYSCLCARTGEASSKPALYGTAAPPTSHGDSNNSNLGAEASRQPGPAKAKFASRGAEARHSRWLAGGMDRRVPISPRPA